MTVKSDLLHIQLNAGNFYDIPTKRKEQMVNLVYRRIKDNSPKSLKHIEILQKTAKKLDVTVFEINKYLYKTNRPKSSAA